MYKPECVGWPYWPASSEVPWGVAIQVITHCRLCDFKGSSLEKLYTEIPSTKPGRKKAAVNMQIASACTKMSCSYADVRLLLNTMDSPCMSEVNFYTLMKTAAPMAGNLGSESIMLNREVIKMLAQHNPNLLGHGGLVQVPAQSDTVYNNRPHGIGYSSPGTQSATTVMEGITTQKLIIALRAFNQLCSNGGSDCNHTSCGRNYPQEKTIDSTERQASVENYMELIESGIQVTRLCHDGIQGSHHLAGMRDGAASCGVTAPESSPCIVHLKRNNAKQVFKFNLSSQALGDCPRDQVNKKRNVIGNWFADRISLELKLAHEVADGDHNKFVSVGLEVSSCIIPCSMGVHSLCDKFSRVCTEDKRCKPGATYLMLTLRDQELIFHHLVKYRMSQERLSLQKFMSETNRAESFNRSILKMCPKEKTYAKYFTPRCLSAVHTDTKGVSESVMEQCGRLGAPITPGGRAHKGLQQLQTARDKWRRLRKTFQHKRRVRALRKKRSWLRAFRRLNIESAVDVPETMHDYALRDRK